MLENSFQEHRLKILGDIQRINDSLVKFQDIVLSLTVEVAEIKTTTKVKTIAWGSFGGGLVVIITIIIATITLWGTFWGKG